MMKKQYTTFWAVVALTCMSVPANSTTNGPLLIDGIDTHKQHIYFASNGKIWQVNRKGGQATAITNNRPGVNDRFPVVSPDGQSLAFQRNVGGNSDVYSIKLNQQGLTEGSSLRLTYHPAYDYPVSWSNDSKYINLSSVRGVGYSKKLYQVENKQGAFASPHPVLRGEDMSINTNGKIAFVPLSHDPQHSEFRYYRGGKRGEIHLINRQNDSQGHKWQAQSIINQQGSNVYNPQWLEEHLYYLADNDQQSSDQPSNAQQKKGVANLYHFDGQKHQQLSHFNGYGIRDYAIDEQGIILLRNGRIYAKGLASTTEAKPIDIKLTTSDKLTKAQHINASRYITSKQLSNDGKKLLVNARGDIFLTDWKTGQSQNLTNSPANDHEAKLAPNGEDIAFFSDGYNSQQQRPQHQLVIASINNLPPAKAYDIEIPASFYRNIHWSPDSQKLVFSDNRLKLWLFNRQSKQLTEIVQSQFSGQGRYNISWSHDSSKLAFNLRDAHGIGQIQVYDLNDKTTHAISRQGQFADHPVFDPNGRYLYFLTSPNAHTSGYGWGVLNGVWQQSKVRHLLNAAILKQGDIAPILPGATANSDQPNLSLDINQITDNVVIDYQDIENRIIRFSAVNHHIGHLWATAPGQLQWINLTWKSPNQIRQRPEYQLQQLYIDAPNEVTTLISKLDELISSDNKKWSHYKKGNSYFVTPLNVQKPQQIETRLMANLQLPKKIEPKAQWQQMFNETFNYIVEQLYDPNFHGINKQALYDNYAAYLPNITSRTELTKLLRRMAGQISVSHIRIDQGDRGFRTPNMSSIGLLGGEFEQVNGRYRLKRVFKQSNALNAPYAPLDQYGSKMPVGSYIISINNQQVTSKHNLYRYLRQSANKTISLTYADNPQGENTSKLQITTIADDNPLITADWAQANQKFVDKQTNGQIKYVHYYRSNQQGIENTLNGFYHLGDAKGFIIDVRYNRGGTTVDGLIDLLQRKGIYKYRFRQGVDLSTPVNAYEGQTTIIINQYNASAAETFAMMFKTAQLGEVVGKPTYGGGIGPYVFTKQLVDGARIQIPNRGSYLANGQWTIENRGVHPTVDVENDLYLSPNAGQSKYDAQLIKAIEVNRKQQQEGKVKKYKEPEYPRHPKLQ